MTRPRSTLARRGASLAAAGLLALAAAPALAEEPGHGAAATDHGAAAGHGGGHGLSGEELSHRLGEVGIHAVNFALLIGLLVWAGRRPVGDYLRNRAAAVRGELQDSARVRDDARAKYAEYDRRLAAFDQEIKGLVDRVRAECQVEHDQAMVQARAMADGLVQTTRRAVEEEARRAHYELRREAVDLAVRLAEGVLREGVTADDQRRLADTYLSAVGGTVVVRSEVAES
ncbi:ATP synthase F0 subunit B [Myxococcota bacterium]|nr:ATP synthase F0 subunit B [Myxococcota bacterium]